MSRTETMTINVNGNLMNEYACGVHDNGGESLGIAPEWINDFEPLCENCSEFIYVNTMDER